MSISKLLSFLFIILISASCGKFDKGCKKDNKCTFCEDEKFEGKGLFMGWINDKLDDEKEDDRDEDGDWDKDDKDDFSNEWDDKEIDREHKEDGRCGNSIQQVIVEELIIDESCGCIVDGMIKYIQDGETVALVKYNDTDCEGIGYKIHCVDGDCESKKAKCCIFEQECDQEMGEIKIH
jgi:hypothetical protein